MNESKLKSSVTLRMIVMAMVVLFLLIMAVMIRSLISERQYRRDEADWGNVKDILARPSDNSCQQCTYLYVSNLPHF